MLRWIVIESTTRTKFKEQLARHGQVPMDTIYGSQRGHWTQHPDPSDADYHTVGRKINIDSGKAWGQSQGMQQEGVQKRHNTLV